MSGVYREGVYAAGVYSGSVPDGKAAAETASELHDIADAVLAMPLPPEQPHLDALQPRVAAVAAKVAAWKPAPIIVSPEPAPELPEPGRTIRAVPDTLRRLLAENREPGDRILLAPGVYEGDLDLPFDVPLQIVAERPLEAVLAGDVSMTGSGIVLSGVDIRHPKRRSGTSVAVSGKRCRLHRSRVFRSAGTCVDLVGEECDVEWCDLSVWGRQEVPNAPSGTDFGLIRDDGGRGRHNRILRCLLHDGPLKQPGDYHKYGITGIGVGINPRNFQIESGLEVAENLLEDCGDCDIAIKTSRNVVRGNTILGRKAKSYGNQRSGNHNQWLDNWFDDLAYGFEIVVHGGHHLIAGNRARMALRWGNFDWNKMPSGDTRHHRAFAVRCAGNEGPPVVYGHRYSGEVGKLKLPPKDCVFIDQPYTDKGGGIGARVEESAVEPSKARKLTREEVGPVGKIADG